MAKILVSPSEFNRLLRETNAVKIEGLWDKNKPEDKAIWFETGNFGWILSAVDPETGRRKILAQC